MRRAWLYIISFQPSVWLFAFVFAMSLFSCDRIKRKGRLVVENTTRKFADQKDAIADKVIPTFDSYEPDTKFNRNRFGEFFGFAPPADVNSIYCFSDQMGIDSRFQFSFKCDPATKNRIVANLKLSESSEPDNTSSGLWQRFSWWDSVKIVALNPYRYKGDHEYYRYLWFDTGRQIVYYIEYNL